METILMIAGAVYLLASRAKRKYDQYLEDLEVTFPGFRAKISGSELRLIPKIGLYNPSPISVTITDIPVKILVDDSTVAQANFQEQLEIPADDKVVFEIIFRVKAIGTINTIVNILLGNKPTNIEIRGRLKGPVGEIDFSKFYDLSEIDIKGLTGSTSKSTPNPGSNPNQPKKYQGG